MPTVPLTTVAQVKRYLRMSPEQLTGQSSPASVDDGLLQDLVNAASDDVARYCERNFLQAAYTEKRNGTGTSYLVLANSPIIDVTDVRFIQPLIFGGQTPSGSTVLVAGIDYTFDTFKVLLYSATFPRGVANISVTYSAGFVSVPADVAHATAKWCALRYREFDRLGQKSKTLGGESVTLDDSEMPGDIAGILSRYRVKIAIPGSFPGVPV